MRRLSRAVARRRRAVDRRRAIEVVALEILGTAHRFFGQHRAERNHVAVGVAHVVAIDVGGIGACVTFRLRLHTKRSPEQVEVVDVIAAHEHLQREEDVAQRQAVRFHFVAIDFVFDLRRAVVVIREHESKLRPLARFSQQLLQRLGKCPGIAAARVLQDELEAAGRAQAADRRRI